MAGMTEAFFVRDGERFVPTELTRGPWDPNAQHGGPTAALLGTAIEECERRPDVRVVRVTFEILRPIPIVPLTVSARMIRSGKSVQVVGATLSAGIEEIVRAQAVRIRTADIDVLEPVSPPPPGPEYGQPSRVFPPGIPVGYHSAMERSFVRGNL